MHSCALLVIDLQVGAFDGKLLPAIHEGEELLAPASQLIAAARAAKLPVLFVQHCAPPGQLLTEGTDRWQIHSAVAARPGECIVRKRESRAPSRAPS